MCTDRIDATSYGTSPDPESPHTAGVRGQTSDSRALAVEGRVFHRQPKKEPRVSGIAFRFAFRLQFHPNQSVTQGL